MREERSVILPTGRLDVGITRAEAPIDAFCGFAARKNPKRGFLFVSKLLGKHVPVSAERMAKTHAELAERIPKDLPGPVLFVAMAETAIALGLGVAFAWKEKNRRNDVLAIHTTRHPLAAPIAIDFKEEHCHAPSQFLHEPLPEHRERFAAARSVILVDDETSTGRTFSNLFKAIDSILPSVERRVAAVLTDWRGSDFATATFETASLLEGNWNFSPTPEARRIPMPSAEGIIGKKYDVDPGWGRRGLIAEPDVENFLRDVPFAKKLLILGTGEFSYPPFLLARVAERKGIETFVQSTTRSPAMLGGAIEDALSFRDNYGDGIANHLYNPFTAERDAVLLCSETDEPSMDRTLVAALEATTLVMRTGIA